MSYFRNICFIIFIAGLVACNPSAKTTTTRATSSGSPQKTKKELSEEELINLKYLFVNANKEKILGNKNKAAELFAQCIRIDGSNHAAMYELATIYAEQKKINDALFFARGASQIEPSNTWYRLFLAE